ncbi:MAG TPA: Crp/Fnr family transcriptional regulator [Burkholderiales bacterium]|nr:Crp/Fnr family transcriptional regulator [Burkholderiales bacterium]
MPLPLAKTAWPGGNLVLSAIPVEEGDGLLPQLRLVALRGGQVLCYAGHTIGDVHFPIDSVVAKVSVDRRGATAEGTLIGHEGLAGLNALLGDCRAGGHAIVQIPGRAYRLAAAPLREAFERSAVMRRMILRYIAFRIFQTSQISLCIARHSVEQRLSRWLLQALDCAGRGELRVTHELIGVALGVRREAVTTIALRLQAAGAIRCSRGRITAVDRAALGAASCECYAVLKRDLDLMKGDLARL